MRRGIGMGRPPAERGTFQPRVIATATNAGAQRARDAFRKALATKRDQLRVILTDLEAQAGGDKSLLAEAEWVRCQLERLMGGEGNG